MNVELSVIECSITDILEVLGFGGRVRTNWGRGGGLGVKSKTETVNCKNAKSIKISYVNNSKLVADIVININFVCETFVIWSYYTKVIEGRGLTQLSEAQKTTGSKMKGKLQILNRTELSELNM